MPNGLVQTVYKGYQQLSKVATSKEMVMKVYMLPISNRENNHFLLIYYKHPNSFTLKELITRSEIFDSLDFEQASEIPMFIIYNYNV